MDNWSSKKRWTIFAAIFVGAFLIFHNSEKIAAWVQAGGSIAAVLIALEIASRQHRETLLMEERRRVWAQKALLTSALAISREAVRLLDSLPNEKDDETHAQGKVNQSIDLASIEDVHAALDKIPVDQFHDGATIVAVFEVKRSLRGVQHDYTAVQTQIWASNPGWRGNAAEIGKRQTVAREAVAKIEQAIAATATP
ncbi:hypothetical protein [Paraburkholderia lacunae]|uniref:Uncharacterized protein n=1 Tax=Paraburkholderia lacunae TaxID=2211104 RepID=A0A370N7P5_9BURK|nr:hypothetical protein [Paraburkholderia lacunae]RDK01611.1 hypothetical protein DLM46_17575 [Paraburkholderia lacunae]